MKNVAALDEGIIRDIGHAFAHYDYGAERGLIDAFPNREAVAAFICGYVRMSLQSGMLYAVGENSEGYIAYRLPEQKVRPRAMLPLAKGLLGSMKFTDLIRFAQIMSQGGTSLHQQFDRAKIMWMRCPAIIAFCCSIIRRSCAPIRRSSPACAPSFGSWALKSPFSSARATAAWSRRSMYRSILLTRAG